MAIFESVQFLNDNNEFIIECELLDKELESLNEAILFKFIKKKEVPESFRDEALKICKYLEEKTGKKGTLGANAAGIRSAIGIRINNSSKRIENGKIKNCYILSFSHKDINKAAGVEIKIFDMFFVNGKLIQDYMSKVLSELGYKKISEKAGANFGYYKNKDGYICGVDCGVIDGGVVNIYIRCLKDCEENKEILAGGKAYKD